MNLDGPEPTLVAGSTVVCPGSYDPVTYGHLDVLRRVGDVFDRVVVGVVRQPKHKTPFFELEERLHFLRESLADPERFVVAGFAGLVVEFAREWGAVALVKGLRAVSDYEWELQMSHLNRMQAPEIETLWIPSSPQYSFISSSGVKEIAAFGGAVEELVPPVVARAFERRLAAASDR